MKKHINIPVFIPHLGCPNACVFCNQRVISGVSQFDSESVIPIIDNALSTVEAGTEAELAFFGGSFTGIEYDLMCDLLKIANGYLKPGRISSIRCSTRPDYIDAVILDTLKQYGVSTVELGLQSVSDSVLRACERGHTMQDEKNACKLIKEHGLRLGGQMMIGLPGSTLESELQTARFIVEYGCDEARIYPTVVFRDTALCTMAKAGEYSPLCLEDAVSRSALVFAEFVKAGIKVLRIGLCESENLHSTQTYFAGPNHPALGELVENEYYYNTIRGRLPSDAVYKDNTLTVYVAKGHISKAVGQHKTNKIRILREYGFSDVKIKENSDISNYDVLLKIEERK